MRCSGAVLLRVADNRRLYCTWKATILATRPAWCTAWGSGRYTSVVSWCVIILLRRGSTSAVRAVLVRARATA